MLPQERPVSAKIENNNLILDEEIEEIQEEQLVRKEEENELEEAAPEVDPAAAVNNFRKLIGAEPKRDLNLLSVQTLIGTMKIETSHQFINNKDYLEIQRLLRAANNKNEELVRHIEKLKNKLLSMKDQGQGKESQIEELQNQINQFKRQSEQIKEEAKQ